MNLANFYDDTSGYNELFLAVHNGDVNLVNSLLEKYSAKETIRGKTLLNVATAKGHAEIVKKLLDNGIFIEEEDSWGITPLNVALAKGNVQIAEILFQHGAFLSEENSTNEEPLYSAVREGNLEMVKLLMANGYNEVEIASNDIYSKSCLKLAILSGRLDIIEYLMENGVEDGGAVEDDKLGLFRSLFSEGSLSNLKCLVDIGIKLQNLDEVFDGTFRFGRHDMWKYLVTRLSRINANTYFKEKKLHSSIRMGQLETVKRIVNEPSNEYDSDTFARQLAVYIAVESGNEEILKILLIAGYPVDDSVFKFITPLHLAATFEHPRLVKLLLQAGADVNLQTEDRGHTPLHFAATAAQPAVVKYLLKNGADPSKTSKFGDSPLKMTLKIHSGPVVSTCVNILFVNPLVFARLVKVTEMLIPYSDSETNKDLFKEAIEMKVSSIINNSTSESESYESDFVFRPEIVRCICNYLSEEEVKYCFKIIEYLFEYPIELLQIMTEYTNNSKSCYDIKMDPMFENSDCQLLLICYSKNVDNLLASIGEMIDDYDNDERYLGRKYIRKVLKLLVCRLVLLNTNCDLTQFKNYELIDDLIEWQKNCLQEKIVMQRTRVVGNLNISYYDVLTKSIDKVAGYTNNEDFLTAMKSSDEKFPIYAEFFKPNVEIAERRQNHVNECTILLYRVIKEYYKIRVCISDVRHILQYLSIVDLERFSVACS